MLVARTLLLSLIQACGAATLQMDREARVRTSKEWTHYLPALLTTS